MNRICIPTVLTVALLAAGCQSQQQKPTAEVPTGPELLSGQQLSVLFQNGLNTKWRTKRANGTTVYRADGSSMMQWAEHRTTGSWRLKDNSVCTRWQGIRNGNERCFQWAEVGSGKYEVYNLDGSWAGVNELMMR